MQKIASADFLVGGCSKSCSAQAVLIPVLNHEGELMTCLTRIAGLALIRRVALMACKAGFDSITVVSGVEEKELSDVLAGSPARCKSRDDLDAQPCDGAVLVLAPDCLPHRDFFSSLGEKRIKPNEMLLWDDGKAVLLGAGLSRLLFRSLLQAQCFGQLVADLRKSAVAWQPERFEPEQVGQTVLNAEDCARAENSLLSALVKQTEGWMALHINRKVSLAVTRRLMHTAVTPNHMTWVSMIIGLIGAACFFSPEHGLQIWGAVFFLLHSILDGCDGELARLKFMESRSGGILDFWSDNIVHVAVFAAMGAGWSAHSPDSFWPGLCAALAVGGTAISASLVYFHTMHSEKKAGPLYTSVSTAEDKSAVVRIADMLSRRDFIYLVLVLALFGQTHWFLVLTAIGAPVYALTLLAIMIRD